MAYPSDIRVLPTYRPIDFGAGFAVVKHWIAVSKERRALRNMTFSQLDDIGLTASDAGREASRPFWASVAR